MCLPFGGDKRNQGRNEERKEHDTVTVREKKNGK